ncbi:MAG: phosphate/phosphite/phosphonate ABC transporter substrate-binding protein [Acidimicrobiia bacterium]
MVISDERAVESAAYQRREKATMTGKRLRIPTTWILICTLALIVAACGGTAATTTQGSAATTAAETTTTAAETTTTESMEPTVLRFGVTPADDSAGQEERFGAMVAALEEDLGVEVEFITTQSYAGHIEGLIAGDLDISVMSPFAYVIATGAGADIEARGAYITSPTGQPVYRSHGLARADSPDVASIEDYAGKRICFVDPGSASGFLIPSAGLLAVGIDPEADLAEAIFAGGHDTSVLAIADGSCDAGFAVDTQLDRAIAEGDVAEGELVKVWESADIPGVVLTVSGALPEDLRDAIADVFLNNTGADLYERGFCNENWVEQDGPTGTPWCPIAGTSTWGFAVVDDSLYDSLREVCELTQAPACTETG